MLSRLSKLATKQILRNIKCKKSVLALRGKRSFFTSLQQCQEHAQKLSNALRCSKTNDYSEVSSMVADNMQFNLSNDQTNTRQDFITLQKHFAQHGEVPQIIAQVYRWNSHSYAMYYLSRFISYSDNREAISSGVGILSVNDDGKITSLGYSDSGSLGPLDDLLNMETIWQGEKPFFDTVEKAQEYAETSSQLFEDDINNGKCGNGGADSQFAKKYFADDMKLLSSNLIADKVQAFNIPHMTSLACSSTKYNVQLRSNGPYSLYTSFQWSHVYKDGTHGTFDGDQILYLNKEGKVRAAHLIFGAQGSQDHVQKLEEILGSEN